jgi:streptomycin 6-kinase
MKSASTELRRRIDDRIKAWRIAVDHVAETESSVLAFGRRDADPVVLKVVKHDGDEWRSGEILDAFDGKGVVRVHDYVEGALLLERLTPGNSLASLPLHEDDRATGILAEVIGKMSPRTPGATVPAVQDWAQGFERYAAGGDAQIPRNLLLAAQRVYSELCGSQTRPRLLHGDLHHDNVLFDAHRGWLAIDPKGVVGELEFEIGAALRNPYEIPELFTEPSVIKRRVERLARELSLDATRLLAWGFAQAVLATVWTIEDGDTLAPNGPWIRLADAIRSMLAV